MKKLILLTVCAVMSMGAFAQSFDWGIKGGLNISNVSSSDLNSKASVYLGAFAQFPITDLFAIQPEVVYSRQGGKNGDFKLRLNYLNVPVLARFDVVKHLDLYAGPQFGFKLNAKSVQDGTSVDVGDDVKGFDFSLALGGAYAITERIGVEARYNIGLTDLVDAYGVDSKNGVFQIGVTYKF